MGYHAKGDGGATFKENVDLNELKFKLSLLNTDIEYDFCDNSILFWENDTHWHEEDTYEFLDTITPYVIDGTAHYSSCEDVSLWRYKLDTKEGKWIEQPAIIDYDFENYLLENRSDEQLIAELEKRGYDVSGLEKDEVER